MTQQQHIRFQDWGAANRPEMRRLAIEGIQIPMPTRLMFLAMAESNRIGHATFRPDEVRLLLERLYMGQLKPLSSRQFGDALNKAIALGLLAYQNRRRCLILSPNLWQQARFGSSSCDYCGVGPKYRKRDRIASELSSDVEVEGPDFEEIMRENFPDEEVLLPSVSL